MAVSNQSAQNLTVNAVENGWDGTTLGSELSLPGVYSLKEAYPNPFNPTTTIDYTLKENSDVSIVVYDLKVEKLKLWLMSLNCLMAVKLILLFGMELITQDKWYHLEFISIEWFLMILLKVIESL